jgi:hypothetical protein
LPSQSLKSYSLLLKKQKEWPRALDIWQKLIENSEEILFSCEELAKYYEHRESDIKQALEYTNRALDYIRIVDEINVERAVEDIRARFEHRLNRLSNKLHDVKDKTI